MNGISPESSTRIQTILWCPTARYAILGCPSAATSPQNPMITVKSTSTNPMRSPIFFLPTS